MNKSVIIPVSRPSIDKSDIQSVTGALEELQVSGHSEVVSLFEESLENFLGTQHAIAVSSGTTAIDLIADYLEIDDKSSVVCPTFSIISTLLEFARRKARITLVDADPETWSIDFNQLKGTLESKENVNAVVATHIYNSCFDVKKTRRITEKFGVALIEDAAEAFGSTYNNKKLGTFGDFGIFSFYANKLVTTGEGGAIVSEKIEVSNKIKILRNLGFDPNQRFLHRYLGRNARMSGLNAALGLSQLVRAESFRVHRRQLYETYVDYLQRFEQVIFQKIKFDEFHYDSSYWVMPILLKHDIKMTASTLQEKLKTRGIETRRFFCPMHLQPILQNYPHIQKHGLPVSENLWEKGLYLPMGSGITMQEVEQVCKVLDEIFE